MTNNYPPTQDNFLQGQSEYKKLDKKVFEYGVYSLCGFIATLILTVTAAPHESVMSLMEFKVFKLTSIFVLYVVTVLCFYKCLKVRRLKQSIKR